ncbi:MAG: 2-oxoglutarate dehydrogenase [Chlamydiae bacterium]|nr:2-oxoglutarate dehydrogenase [Chlamydiota bacterium]
MQQEIRVPLLGESISKAVIVALLIPEGSPVHEGQDLLELETDKVNQTLTAEVSGIVSWYKSVGDTVNVGDTIGNIELREVSSASKRMPQGQPKLEIPCTKQKMSTLRRTLSARLVEAKNKTAMLTTFNEVDMTALQALREERKESFFKQYGVKFGLMSPFLKATALALQQFPLLNSYLEGDDIVTPSSYDLGVAISTDHGLVVPVIRRCHEKTLSTIEQEIVVYTQKARGGSLSLDDLRGGTFTVTNGGVFGSLLSTPILNPPQSGILGMHAIQKRPVAIEDKVVIRPMMYLALSYDHRMIDGKDAVLFLLKVKEHIENPSFLLTTL